MVPIIRTVCGWCGVLLVDAPTDEKGQSSHGICNDCKTGKFRK